MNKDFRFLIVGGGTGGISVAARIKKAFKNDSVGLIEPSDYHYYQPMWTLVGGGIVSKEITKKPMHKVIPHGVDWLKDQVIELLPGDNKVKLASGEVVSYKYLILAPGLKVDFKRIKGVHGNLGKNGLCSVYNYEEAEKTFEQINSFDGGKAIFTFPPAPIKCAGAPQKIMYLAEELFRTKGIRSKSEVSYFSNSPSIFGVPVFAKALNGVIESRGIKTNFLWNLIEVKADQKIAIFEKVAAPIAPVPPGCGPFPTPPVDPQLGEKMEVKYDLLHVAPPNSPPDFISTCDLAWTEGPNKGWLRVDQYTLQSPKYQNVFGLGDVTGIPNAKTGAAIRKQAPVLVQNLVDLVEGKSPTLKYDGYASCPLVTSRSSVILAEFGYDGKLLPSFPLDPTKERYIYWLFKRFLLPKLYWWGMLKGIL